jgi:hypothetical protein
VRAFIQTNTIVQPLQVLVSCGQQLNEQMTGQDVHVWLDRLFISRLALSRNDASLLQVYIS